MAARQLGILLLLAAVFSMHSIAFASAEPGAAQRPAATADHGTGGAASDSVTLQLSGASAVLSPEHLASSALAAADPMPPGVPIHDMATHFLAVCLAVLLAGLGWLIYKVRAPDVATPVVRCAGPRPRLDMGWFRPPRPPDLSALCLLRI